MMKMESKMAKKTKKTKKTKSKSKFTNHNRTFEGLPVVDANEDIALVIKKEDVNKSKVKDPAACAAALAGRREFKTDVRVFLTRTFIKDNKNKQWIRFYTPESMSREITSFDRGATFEPGEYKLKSMPMSQRAGYKKPTGPKKETGRPTHKKHITANVRVNAKNY